MESAPRMGNSQERGAETIPTMEEVLFELGKYCENPKIKRELRDETGIYVLEVEGQSKTNPGENVECTYQRKGTFPNKDGSRNESSATEIHILSFKDGDVVGADNVAGYNHDTNQWEEKS